MQVRTQTKIALTATALSTLTLPALAGTAGAIDRVPTDAPVVIGIPDVREFLADMDQLNVMLGEDANAEMMMGIMMIRGMEGLNLDGSAALVVYPGDDHDDEDWDDEHDDMGDMDDIDIDVDHDWDDEDRFVAIVPVADFGALTHGREAVNGLVSYPLPEDQTGYFRDIGGGFALFGDNPEHLIAFNASEGRMNANNALIGSSGQSIATSSDIFMYVNLAEMDDEIAEAKESMEEQGEMISMMGGEQAQAGFDAFLNAFETAVEDGQAFIGGLNFDSTQGISFDAGLQFKEGSESASYLDSANANATKYLNNIPAGDYFYAATMDFSGTGIKRLFGDYMDLAKQQDPMGLAKMLNFEQMVKHANGGAQVMGASNPMGMTGLFTTMSTYTATDDSNGLITAMGDMFTSLDGTDAEGVSVTSSFDQAGTEIDGSLAHAYHTQITIDLPADNSGGGFGAPNPQMMMQMMFGPSLGPTGYLGKAGDGIVQTMSKDQAAYTRAVAAANGKNTLGSLALVQQSAARLQDNTVMELYFGADHTLNTVGPMLMMFGVVPEFEPLDAHAPVALGFTADGGGATMRAWIPMQVIGSVMELIPEEMLDQMHGDDMDWNEGDDADDDMDF